MSASRLPRFRRSGGIRPIVLTKRDHKIIQLMFKHRFLRSLEIIALICEKPQPVLRRLQLLFHHGYIERPRAQLDFYHRGGSRPFVYGLGSRAASVLTDRNKTSSTNFRWSEKNRSVGRVFLEHTLLVSEFMVGVELACRTVSVRFLTGQDIQRDLDKERLFRWRVNLENGVRLGVIPDHVFGFEFPDAHGKSTRAYFFLEADRGTMPVKRRNLSQTSIYRKFLAYEASWSQSIHEKRFGFHRFRVLIVTKSKARMNAMIETCSQLNSGRGLFLFADQASFQTPSNPLSPIWHTATGHGPVGLIPNLLLPDATKFDV